MRKIFFAQPQTEAEDQSSDIYIYSQVRNSAKQWYVHFMMEEVKKTLPVPVALLCHQLACREVNLNQRFTFSPDVIKNFSQFIEEKLFFLDDINVGVIFSPHVDKVLRRYHEFFERQSSVRTLLKTLNISIPDFPPVIEKQSVFIFSGPDLPQEILDSYKKEEGILFFIHMKIISDRGVTKKQATIKFFLKGNELNIRSGLVSNGTTVTQTFPETTSLEEDIKVIQELLVGYAHNFDAHRFQLMQVSANSFLTELDLKRLNPDKKFSAKREKEFITAMANCSSNCQKVFSAALAAVVADILPENAAFREQNLISRNVVDNMDQKIKNLALGKSNESDPNDVSLLSVCLDTTQNQSMISVDGRKTAQFEKLKAILGPFSLYAVKELCLLAGKKLIPADRSALYQLVVNILKVSYESPSEVDRLLSDFLSERSSEREQMLYKTIETVVHDTSHPREKNKAPPDEKAYAVTAKQVCKALSESEQAKLNQADQKIFADATTFFRSRYTNKEEVSTSVPTSKVPAEDRDLITLKS